MFSADAPAEERIVAAALDLFGHHGFRGTSVRAVADQAGVSPALVIHHFGSKEGLRSACEDWVLDTIRATKDESIAAGPDLLPGQLGALMARSRPAVRYLARTLTEGSPRIDEFVDGLVEDSIGYTARAQEAGLVRPSADHRTRTIVLTLWMLSPLVLHRHLHRLLGVDLLAGDPDDALPYVQTAIEILVDGVLTEAAYPTLRNRSEDGGT